MFIFTVALSGVCVTVAFCSVFYSGVLCCLYYRECFIFFSSRFLVCIKVVRPFMLLVLRSRFICLFHRSFVFVSVVVVFVSFLL